MSDDTPDDTAAAVVVVFACGNPGRGDDALGPRLAEHVARWIEAHPGSRVKLVCDVQLQVEHALELDGCHAAMFVDAALDGPAPFRLEAIAARRDATWTTHALSPQALLQVFEQVRKRPPPPAMLLAIRGYDFDLGAELGAAARANLQAAWAFLEGWLAATSSLHR